MRVRPVLQRYVIFGTREQIDRAEVALKMADLFVRPTRRGFIRFDNEWWHAIGRFRFTQRSHEEWWLKARKVGKTCGARYMTTFKSDFYDGIIGQENIP